MKKLLIATTVIGSLIHPTAFAKTEGNYVGVDVLATQFKSIGRGDLLHKEWSPGVGVSYKHAFNFDDLFVAPGVYFNYNNAEVSYDIFKLAMDYSYGAKVDLGYDVTDKLAPFISIGYQENRISFFESGVLGASQTEELITYGVGTKYSITNNVDLAIAYEYGDYKKDDTISSLNTDVIKIGASYKF